MYTVVFERSQSHTQIIWVYHPSNHCKILNDMMDLLAEWKIEDYDLIDFESEFDMNNYLLSLIKLY
jgi:hypothetical protein